MKTYEWIEKALQHMEKLDREYNMVMNSLKWSGEYLPADEIMNKIDALKAFDKNYRKPFWRFLKKQEMCEAYHEYEQLHGYLSDSQALRRATSLIGKDNEF